MPETRAGAEAKGPSAQAELTPVEREQISRRAYEIWAEEGFPDGRDQVHWSRAELEVLKARG